MKLDKEKLKPLVKNLLLAFVFIAIGFALGKELSLRSFRKQEQIDLQGKETTGKEKLSKVIVYYMHATFRCNTCNTIEKLAHEVVTTQFADALESGILEWRVADFQTNEALAEKYDVVASGVVVVKNQDDKEEFKDLKEVWILIKKPVEFKEYVSKAIEKYLNEIRDR